MRFDPESSRTSCTRTVKAPFIAVLVLALVTGSTQGKYGGGNGTTEEPYLIYTAEQMNTIGTEPNDWDKHFKLMADLDLSGYRGDSFNLIGDYSVHRERPTRGFAGVFHGNGHTISGFTYIVDVNRPGPVKDGSQYPAESHIGLFRYIWGDGQIRNLGLIDPNVRPANTCIDWVTGFGALAGMVARGTIQDCYIEGGCVAADGAAGGLVGQSGGLIVRCHSTCRATHAAGRTLRPWQATEVPLAASFGGLVGSNSGEIRESYATGVVQGPRFTGGLVGSNSISGIVRDCFATGTVSGSTASGGLAGVTWTESEIRASYATGRVSGDSAIGGLVGQMDRGGRISNCYATGSVSGDHDVGGLVGEITQPGSRIENCYSTGLVAGKDAVGGLVGKDPRLSYKNPDDRCVYDSFWDTQTTGQEASAGGGAGRTTTEMQSLWTYLGAGWDFAVEAHNGTQDIWTACCGRPTYPKLAWQKVPAGDFDAPDGVDFRDLVVLVRNWLLHEDLPCHGADLTFDARLDFKDFAVLAQWWRRGTRKIIYETALDSTPGWRLEGEWQFGKPAGLGGNEHGHPDPNSGHTGENVYGVNLDGDYRIVVDGAHYLTAGPFDCRGYHNVKLQFTRWLNTDAAGYVRATVEVSNDGNSWSAVWVYADEEAELTDDEWIVVVCDIGADADYQPRVYVRWGYEVLDEGAWALSGWNIDDIAVFGYEDP
jgi:hypothetical protein